MSELLSMSRGEAEGRVRQWVDDMSNSWEANLVVSGGYAFFDKDEADRMGEEQAGEIDDLFRVISDTVVRPLLKKDVAGALSGRDRSDRLKFVKDAISQEIAPELDLSSVDGQILGRAVLKGFATMLEEQSSIEAGEFAPLMRMSDTAVPSGKQPDDAATDFEFLSRWDDFAEAKVSDESWKPDTVSNARSSRNLLAGFLGEKSKLSDVNRKVAAAFRPFLFGLPSLYDKAKLWRDRPLHDVIQEVRELNAKVGIEEGVTKIPTLKLATVDKHFGNLVEYWNWLVTSGDIPGGLENPFSGFIQSKPKGRKARKERNAWPKDMITALFQSPIWTGCKGLHRRSDPGDSIFRDAMFWVPLIGRFIGAREDEICSRKVGDIRFVAGIPVLKIEESKTDESDREIPLPDALLELGFLEFRYHGRETDEPLFPELLPQGPGKRRSAAFSGRFTDYRKAIDCYKKLVDFHSMRHNISTDLANLKDLNLGWADEITGHESAIRSSERSRYTKEIYVHNLKETIDRVDIGVDLSHLRYTGIKGVPVEGALAEIEVFRKKAERDMKAKENRRGKNVLAAKR